MVEQIFIGLFGVSALALSLSPKLKWKKWGCILGLCSQPFWLYSAYKASQWGILTCSVLYTFVWLKAIYDNWIKK